MHQKYHRSALHKTGIPTSSALRATKLLNLGQKQRMVHALQLVGLSSLVHDSVVFIVIEPEFHLHVLFLPKIIGTGVLFHPSIHLWRYSPFRALAFLIRRLHSSLFAALLLHPLIPSSCSASL